MGTEWETPGYELSEIYDRKEGQAILICTDGFWEFIDEKKYGKNIKKISFCRRMGRTHEGNRAT